MMKKLVYICICAIIISLIGCSSDTSVGETNQDYSVQYVRVYRVAHNADPLLNAVIHSSSELESYYEEYKSQYDLERRTIIVSDSSIGFLDACDQYDEDFFTFQNLLIIYLAEPSGSIRHKVISVEKSKEDNWKILIHKVTPEVGTDDIAEWILFIAVDKTIDDINTITVDTTV